MESLALWFHLLSQKIAVENSKIVYPLNVRELRYLYIFLMHPALPGLSTVPFLITMKRRGRPAWWQVKFVNVRSFCLLLALLLWWTTWVLPACLHCSLFAYFASESYSASAPSSYYSSWAPALPSQLQSWYSRSYLTSWIAIPFVLHNYVPLLHFAWADQNNKPCNHGRSKRLGRSSFGLTTFLLTKLVQGILKPGCPMATNMISWLTKGSLHHNYACICCNFGSLLIDGHSFSVKNPKMRSALPIASTFLSGCNMYTKLSFTQNLQSWSTIVCIVVVYSESESCLSHYR